MRPPKEKISSPSSLSRVYSILIGCNQARRPIPLTTPSSVTFHILTLHEIVFSLQKHPKRLLSTHWHRHQWCIRSPKLVRKVNWPSADAIKVNRRPVARVFFSNRRRRFRHRSFRTFRRRRLRTLSAHRHWAAKVSNGAAVRTIWNTDEISVNRSSMIKKSPSPDDALFEWSIYIITKLEDKWDLNRKNNLHW